MRKFAAAAALFAIALSGHPAAAQAATAGHARPVVHRRTSSSRGLVLGRESLAAVRAAGSARATVTETAQGRTVTASSRLTVSAAADIEIVPVDGAAELAAEPGTLERLRRVLDPRAAAALFTVATEVRRMGPARVAGQVAVRYRLSVELPTGPDIDAAGDPLLAADLTALRDSGVAALTADVWLDQAKRPVRVTLCAAGADADHRLDLRYYDWGAPAVP